MNEKIRQTPFSIVDDEFRISSFQFRNWVRLRVPCGTRRGSLPLLPSGPGGVHEHPSHRARSLIFASLAKGFSSQNYVSMAPPAPSMIINAGRPRVNGEEGPNGVRLASRRLKGEAGKETNSAFDLRPSPRVRIFLIPRRAFAPASTSSLPDPSSTDPDG